MLKKFYLILAIAALPVLLTPAGCESGAVTTGETASGMTTSTPPVVTTPSTPPSATTSAANTPTTTLPNYGGAIIPADEGQGPAEIRLYNYECRPNVLVVTIGTAVTWINYDYWKPLTVVSDDGLFAANVEPTGGPFTYVFNTPGSFGYTIDPYSGVWQGVVIVTE